MRSEQIQAIEQLETRLSELKSVSVDSLFISLYINHHFRIRRKQEHEEEEEVSNPCGENLY